MAHELAWKRRNHEKKVLKRNLIFNKVEIQEPLISNTINYGVEKRCPLISYFDSHKQIHGEIIKLKKLLLKILESLFNNMSILSEHIPSSILLSLKNLLNSVASWKLSIKGSFITTSLLFMLTDFYKYDIMNHPKDDRFVDYFDSFLIPSRFFIIIVQQCNLYEDFVNVISFFEDDMNQILLHFINIGSNDSILIETIFKKFVNINYPDNIVLNILNEILNKNCHYNSTIILPYSIEYLINCDISKDIYMLTYINDPLTSELNKLNYFGNEDNELLYKVTDIIIQYIEEEINKRTVSSEFIAGSIFKLYIALRDNYLLNIQSRDILVEKTNIYVNTHILSNNQSKKIHTLNELEVEMDDYIIEEDDTNQAEPLREETVSTELTRIFNQLINTENTTNDVMEILLKFSTTFPSKVLEKILDEAIRNRDHQELMVTILKRLHPLAFIRNNSNECTIFTKILSKKVSKISTYTDMMKDNMNVFITLCLKHRQNSDDFSNIIPLLDPIDLLENCVIPNISLEYKNNEILAILGILNLIIENCLNDWILYINITSLITNLSKIYASFNRYSLEKQIFNIECLDIIKHQIRWICTTLVSNNLQFSQRENIFNEISFSDWHTQYIIYINLFRDEEKRDFYASLFPTTLKILFESTSGPKNIKPISWIQFIELCSLDSKYMHMHIENNQYIILNNHDVLNGITFTLPYLTKEEFINITTILVPTLLQDKLIPYTIIKYVDIVTDENKNFISVLNIVYDAFKRILKKKNTTSPRLTLCLNYMIKNYTVLLKRMYYEENIDIVSKIVSIDISTDIMVSFNEHSITDLIEPLYILIMDFFDRHTLLDDTLTPMKKADIAFKILEGVMSKLSNCDHHLLNILVQRIESFLNTKNDII